MVNSGEFPVGHANTGSSDDEIADDCRPEHMPSGFLRMVEALSWRISPLGLSVSQREELSGALTAFLQKDQGNRDSGYNADVSIENCVGT